MSVRELKEALAKLQASFSQNKEIIAAFEGRASENMEAAIKALDSTSTGADGQIKSALQQAISAIRDSTKKIDKASGEVQQFSAKL